MKRRTSITLILCLIGCMLIAGCGKKKDGEDTVGKLPEESNVKEQEADSDMEPSKEEERSEKKMDPGKAPKLLHHRGYVFEHNSNGQLVIKHNYSFLSLDEKDAGTYKELAASLKSAKDDIEADEKAKHDKEVESIKENELYSYEENWNTYVRRADGGVISFVTEYVAVGQFDGEYYTEYIAHNYYTENGKEIELKDVVADEDAFFDLLSDKLTEYFDYAKKNIYYIDTDTDKEQIKKDVKSYMNAGICSWTLDPQGISIFLNAYTGLPTAVSTVVLFSEDNEGKIFNKEFLDVANDEWIMQIPERVDSYCDIDDDGAAELVRAYATEEMRENEGSEEYYISGFSITCDRNSQSYKTRMTGGTDHYDAFLMHKDHKTCFLEGHYEYDSAFINTYAADKNGIKEADAVRGIFETSDTDYDPEKENYIPSYIPTDMSRIQVLMEEDSEARDMTSDLISVDPDGKMEIKYGEYEHASLGVNEAVDEVNDHIGKEIEPFFGLWVGAFKDRSAAEELVNKLKDAGLEAYCVYSPEWENLSKEPYYCVTIGESGSEPEAQAYITDAAKAGYKDAYVKYTGDRLSHRIDYYIYSEDTIKISLDEVVLNNVQVSDMSGGDMIEATLVVDKDTVFDKTCDMQFFGNYRQGDSVLEWFNYNKELMETDVDKYMEKGPALKGVFEVSITGNHVDSFYSCSWWD